MCLPCDKTQSFHIYVHLLFLEASHLISLKCACLAVCLNMHVHCLIPECVLGSIMLPNIRPLRDQYVFVMVKFLCVRFSVFSKFFYILCISFPY